MCKLMEREWVFTNTVLICCWTRLSFIKSRYYVLQICYEHSVLEHFYLILYLEHSKFSKIGSNIGNFYYNLFLSTLFITWPNLLTHHFLSLSPKMEQTVNIYNSLGPLRSLILCPSHSPSPPPTRWKHFIFLLYPSKCWFIPQDLTCTLILHFWRSTVLLFWKITNKFSKHPYHNVFFLKTFPSPHIITHFLWGVNI